MIIHDNAWVVGSLAATDPNGKSFKSPQQEHSRGRKRSPFDAVLGQGDSVCIEPQAANRYDNEWARTELGNAISFSQTQDAFLLNVQQALLRMNELSARARAAENSESAQAARASEFVQLQSRIKDIETKMFRATNLFHFADLDAALLAGGGEAPAASDRLMHEVIEKTADPAQTTISDPDCAKEAIDHIQLALQAVANVRANVGNNLQRLCLAGESLGSPDDGPIEGPIRIDDIGVAEANTELARSKILTQSGTAMLAQANALPESALRLLD